MAARLGAECYVNPVLGSDATGDGSAAKPWRTLTFAVSVCPTAGGKVWLAPGTYDAASGESFPITFDWWTWGPEIHGAPDHASVLKTDGKMAFELRGNEGRCSVMEGLLIDGSTANGRASVPGISIRGCSSMLRLWRNRIKGFSIAVDHADDMIGGTFWSNIRAAIEGNEFIDSDIGLALRPQGVGWELSQVTNNLFESNTTAIWLQTSSGSGIATKIWNNTLVGSAGNAMFLVDNGTTRPLEPEIVNNIFAFGGGTAIDDSAGIPSRIDTNLFWSNAGPDWVIGTNAGPDNRDADPGFVDLANGDLHLLPGSAAIDAGTDAAAPAVDKDQNPRPVNGGSGAAHVDIGAYEYRPPAALRRADLTAFDPPNPPLATIFPFAAGNALTPSILVPYASGDRDPQTGILSAPGVPLALYASDRNEVLVLVKDLAGATVEFFIR